ncbi:MAG: BspA family leucine-rich repeat surface protein [Lachnospiraceae bacterium]|nr:BspA family leucine-rich repeat surface protein [Lachnospiraceae bacterium]
MNLYVLNKKFEHIEVIDTYTSIIWTNRYYSYGDFELYLPANKNVLSVLKKDYYIVREGQEDNAMIIDTIKITTDEELGNFLIITGKCLKSIVYRRIIWNQTNLNNTLETCIEQLLNENAICAKDSKRNFENLAIKSMIQTDIAIEAQYCGENLGEVISSLCEQNGLGWDISLDLKEKRFYFSLYSGINRSYQQNKNQWIIFSNGYENLLKTEYTYSKENYKNAALVAGEGEGTERKYTEIGTTKGMERFETFVDAGDVSSNSGEISEGEYKAQLKQKGEETLSENKETENFEGEVVDYQFSLGKDYFLGDIVEIENEYGMQAVSRITEVIESIDESGIYTIPTFSAWEGLCIAEPDKSDDIITFDPPKPEKTEPEEPKDPIIIDATYTGVEFNLAAKKVAGTKTSGIIPQFTKDKIITKIEFTDIPPENKEFETLTETDEGHSIKLYLDNNVLKMYTDVDIIRLPQNMSDMFCYFGAVKEIDLSKFDTSNVTTMQGMFQGCNNLLNLDVSKFNTENVESMKSMFAYCFNLQNLDLSGFGTSNVTNMSMMFAECYELKELNMSSFDTSNVTNMSMMFHLCKSLVSIDVSSFDTSNVTDMSMMFAYCEKIKNIDVSMFNNSSKLIGIPGMFSNCYELENINLANFKTNRVKTMSTMFEECRALTSLDLRSFDTNRAESAMNMFKNCTKLKNIMVTDGKWYFYSSTSTSGMFDGCGCSRVTYA